MARSKYADIPYEYRFWAKIKISRGCWVWTASKNTNGYGQYRLNGKMFLAHRLAYELLEGDIPEGFELDHICHNHECVNPGHLRACSRLENGRNLKLGKANTSGFKGVSWDSVNHKWEAKIGVNHKTIKIGRFNTPEDAYSAYCRAAVFHHGEFANFGEAS